MQNVDKNGFFENFDWKLYPKTEKFLKKNLSLFLSHNSFAKSLSKKLEEKTSTRFFDWVDHISLPSKKFPSSLLNELGFSEENTFGVKVFRHRQSVFFPVLLNDNGFFEVCLKVENLSDFKKALSIKNSIEGKLFAPLRKLKVKKDKSYLLTAIERRGSNGFEVKDSGDLKEYSSALKTFLSRKRAFRTDKEGMIYTLQLIKKFLKSLDKSRLTDAFFRAERVYWQKKNKAGQTQKARQDLLGLGWGNHDHHTYRSSRENFTKLIDIFESMGFVCRESFHAGEKAGWGAQILEHPFCDIVIFADLDLTLQEKDTNFAHKGLSNRNELGTVGLWIGLHGESVLQSGMHHLEARFNFEKLGKDLLKKNVSVMQPFSNFDFLRQAFTKGEHWKVDKKRAKLLLDKGSITKEQFDKFVKEGAIGSHLENLERNQGFKGFNQNSVSVIITATDPRKQHHAGA